MVICTQYIHSNAVALMCIYCKGHSKGLVQCDILCKNQKTLTCDVFFNSLISANSSNVRFLLLQGNIFFASSILQQIYQSPSSNKATTHSRPIKDALITRLNITNLKVAQYFPVVRNVLSVKSIIKNTIKNGRIMYPLHSFCWFSQVHVMSS